MKKFLSLIAIAAMTIFAASCTKEEAKSSSEDTTPKYEVKTPITSATAAQGTYSAVGVIDNTARTIKFVFDTPGVDLSNVTVTLEFAAKATAKNFTEPTVCDLSDGKTATCTVNNQIADVDYTISAVATANPNPVTRVFTTSKSEATIEAEVDNVNYTVKFNFIPGQVEINAVVVAIELGEGCKAGANCFDEKTIDLSSAYKFTVNDGLKDIEYTMTAAVAQASKVPYDQCSVCVGYDGEAWATDPESNGFMTYYGGDVEKPLCKREYLFDGEWLSVHDKFGDTEYRYFGQAGYSDPEGEVPTWFVFDIGENRAIESVTIMPYYSYSHGQVAAIYKFYAYTGTDKPDSVDLEGGMWQEVASDNLYEPEDLWYKQLQFESTGEGKDLCIDGRNVKFSTDTPAARYYLWKMEKNFYMLHGPESDAPSWYAVRQTYFTMSEFIVYAY